MRDDRLRLPLDGLYAESLGRAMFAFSALEWAAINCCNMLEPGYLYKLKSKTAGTIANDLIRLLQADGPLWTTYGAACDEFKRLTKVRNELYHGTPASVLSESRLLDNSKVPWTLDRVDEAADEFVACSILLNDGLLHKELVHRP